MNFEEMGPFELQARYEAVKDRIAAIEAEVKAKVKPPIERRMELLQEAVECAITLGNIALAKLARGDTR